MSSVGLEMDVCKKGVCGSFISKAAHDFNLNLGMEGTKGGHKSCGCVCARA